MKLFTYEGPVGYFDKTYSNNWYGETYAKSRKKALSNLAYQFRMQNRMNRTCKIVLYDKHLYEG